MTAVTITKCKPGYAYGYQPSNGSTEIRDFNMARKFEANLNNKTYGNR